MDQNWKKFLTWQWAETKNYFDLNNPKQLKPPILVLSIGGFLMLIIFLLFV